MEATLESTNTAEYTQETILKRIQGLLTLSKHGASEAEMTNAAEKAQRLMTRYNITQAEAEIAAHGKPNLEFEKASLRWSKAFGFKRATWQMELMDGVCKYNFCKFTFVKRGQWRDIFFIHGKRHNIEMVLHLTQYLDRQMRILCEQRHAEALDCGDMTAELKADTWKKSYLMGLANGIVDRLAGIFAADVGNNETALMLIPVLDVKSTPISDPREILIGMVMSQGKGDAKTININKPVEASKSQAIGSGE